MKQPLLIQDEKRTWSLSILVGVLFALAMLGCFVAHNYETQHEIAIGVWATPSLKVDQAGRQPPQTWPILRVERAHLDPFDLWGRMGQDILLNEKDEEQSLQAEQDWLKLLQAGYRNPRDPKFIQYQFAMMYCAVEEMNKDARIREQFEDLVYNGEDGENAWRDHFTRPVYEAIMMQILNYLEKAEVWLQTNPGAKFTGTDRIPNPWKSVKPVRRRPEGCTDELEKTAKQCVANEGKGLDAVGPSFTSKTCGNAMKICGIH